VEALDPDLLGRVLAADVVAAVSLPPFPTSAVDGYAVRAAEAGAGALPVAARVAAGDPPRPLPAGAAIEVATGAPVPDGADAVVPVERTAPDGDRVRLDAPPRAGENVRPLGGDVMAGVAVARRGEPLTPARLAAIAAAGIPAVQAARRPRVEVVVTGSELVPAGEPLGPGQIYESNGLALRTQAARAGADVVGAGRVRDDREGTERALAAALARADVVVTSGGVSVGPHDHVKPALRALGVAEVFWRIAFKPGKPLWFGVAPGGALVFGLPGNPVSAIVCFELFVRPALLALQGAEPPARPRAVLASPVRRLTARDQAVRCRLEHGEDGSRLVPLAGQESHMVAEAAAADVVALVTRGEGVAEAGAIVEYCPL
jgi:molybdopterin molybdotransferase